MVQAIVELTIFRNQKYKFLFIEKEVVIVKVKLERKVMFLRSVFSETQLFKINEITPLLTKLAEILHEGSFLSFSRHRHLRSSLIRFCRHRLINFY